MTSKITSKRPTMTAKRRRKATSAKQRAVATVKCQPKDDTPVSPHIPSDITDVIRSIRD